MPLIYGIVLAAIAVAGAVAKASAADQNAARNANSLNSQNAIQARQIADANSVQIQQEQEAARRQRALINVSQGDAGINTGSPTVEAQLMDSLFKEDRAVALQEKTNDIQQSARQAQAQSAYNQNLPAPGWVQALQITDAGAQGFSEGWSLGSQGQAHG